MQCSSCGFQNLPGLQHCGRCLSRLTFDNMDIEPYRAADRGAYRRYLRHRLPEIAAAVPRAARSLIGKADFTGVTRQVGFWRRLRWGLSSIVPGLGLVAAGRPHLGWGLLAVWGAALLGLVLLMGSAFWLFMSIMLAVHTMAILNCLFYQVERVSRKYMLLIGLLVAGLLGLLVYPAAGWVVGGLVQFVPLARVPSDAVVRSGDVLAAQGRWLKPPEYQRGDVVSYHIPDMQGPGWFIRRALSIDRILALPGDKVVVREGRFTVNGEPLAAGLGPLSNTGFVGLPVDRELVVPKDCYLIYPSLPAISEVRAGDLRFRLSVVPAGRITGRVWMIASPPWRMGRL